MYVLNYNLIILLIHTLSLILVFQNYIVLIVLLKLIVNPDHQDGDPNCPVKFPAQYITLKPRPLSAADWFSSDGWPGQHTGVTRIDCTKFCTSRQSGSSHSTISDKILQI